jgi:hypothetical protein
LNKKDSKQVCPETRNKTLKTPTVTHSRKKKKKKKKKTT